MSPERLPQYLRTHRKRTGLSQEEVAWLMGRKGDSCIYGHESSRRKPSLESVLAYEIIYGRPAKELFAGFFEAAQLVTRRRAAALIKRLEGHDDGPRTEIKLAVLRALAESGEADTRNGCDA